MKSKYLTILLTLALCSCAQSCNTDDDEYTDSTTSSDDDDTDESEKGYDDDGTGDEIDNSTFSKYITITYDGTVVTVEGAAEGVTIDSSTSDVTITSTAEEVEYTVKGSSTDGSLKIYSDYKYKMVFDGLTLTSKTGAAINNQSKKKLFIELASGTTNSLADASAYTRVTDGEDQKACLFSEGQLILCGTGSLSVKGNYKHAICSDDYVAVSGSPAVSVSGSVKDGIHANDYVAFYGGVTTITTTGSDGIDVDCGYLLMSGGSLSVTTSGSGSKAAKASGNIWIRGGEMSLTATGAPKYDSSEADYKCAACLSSDSSVYISGGIITATTSGIGGKGVKADYDVSISDGSIVIKANGKSGSQGSSKGVKAQGDLSISGGTVYVYSASSEGIESKGVMNISGGVVEVEAYDDGINSGKNMTLSGGLIYSHSQDNDGIDSNGNLYITGGEVVAYGASDPECGLDANDEENYHLYITGGTVFAFGGSNLSYPYSTSGSQAYAILSGSAANVAIKDASGNVIMAWDYSKYANTYTGSNKSITANAGMGGMGGQGGTGGGSLKFLVSSPGMTSGATYYLYSGVTVSASDIFHGLTTTGTVSGGSSSSSASASTGTSSSGNRW